MTAARVPSGLTAAWRWYSPGFGRMPGGPWTTAAPGPPARRPRPAPTLRRRGDPADGGGRRLRTVPGRSGSSRPHRPRTGGARPRTGPDPEADRGLPDHDHTPLPPGGDDRQRAAEHVEPVSRPAPERQPELLGPAPGQRGDLPERGAEARPQQQVPVAVGERRLARPSGPDRPAAARGRPGRTARASGSGPPGPMREYWLRFHSVSRSPRRRPAGCRCARKGQRGGEDRLGARVGPVAGLAGPVAEIRDTWMPPASSDATHRPSRLMARARASRPPGRACPATRPAGRRAQHAQARPGGHVAVRGQRARRRQRVGVGRDTGTGPNVFARGAGRGQPGQGERAARSRTGRRARPARCRWARRGW